MQAGVRSNGTSMLLHRYTRAGQTGQTMAEDDRIVAVSLLTKRDLASLGERFNRAYPVHEDADFTELLSAIDAADLRWGAKPLI